MTEIKSLKEFYDVIESNERVIVYWYTKWCPDCYVTKPHLPRLEQEYAQYKWHSIDRDIDIDLARHLEIFGIPSFLVFQNGEEIGRYVDKQRKNYIQIKTFLDEITT